MVCLDLGANVSRSRTLGTRLSRKTDLDAGIQPIEIDAAAAVEEVVVAVFGGDKPESALGDELLNGSRHCVDLLARTYCLALSRPVRAGPTASAPRMGALPVLPRSQADQTLALPPPCACGGAIVVRVAGFPAWAGSGWGVSISSILGTICN